MSGKVNVTSAGDVFVESGTKKGEFATQMATKAYADAQDTALIAAASATLVETVTATATADGTGTGAISSTANRVLVNVSSDNADKIVKLPPVGVAHKGIQIIFQPATTGYELRTTSPTTTPINGGTGTNAESAIPANTLVICTCVVGPGWICTNYAADGTVSATEPAAAA